MKYSEEQIEKIKEAIKDHLSKEGIKYASITLEMIEGKLSLYIAYNSDWQKVPEEIIIHTYLGGKHKVMYGHLSKNFLDTVKLETHGTN